MEDLTQFLRSEDHENTVLAINKNELIQSMIKYFDIQEMFEDEIFREDFENEEDFNKAKYSFIENLVQWEGQGHYCLTGVVYGELSIIKVDTFLKFDLDPYVFPMTLDLELFTDTENYIKNWKEEEGYKCIYFITHITHVGTPSYSVDYVVYSNKKIENLIQYLYEEKDVFIGEFSSCLGSNYFVEEVEDFSIHYFDSYSLGYEPHWESIYLDEE